MLDNFMGRIKRFAWSPTGAAMAYIAPDTDEPRNSALVLAFAPDFDHPQRLALYAEEDPTWSPDGLRLAFVAWRTSDELQTVMVINADGTGLRDLFPGEAAQTDPGAGFKAIEGWWDAERLVVSTNCGTGCRRPLVLDLTKQTQEALLPPGQEGSQYAWSPDRRAILITSGHNPQIGLLLLQEGNILWRSGHHAMDATWGSFWTFFADWAPDSTRLLFLRQPVQSAEPPELWVWDIETKAASALLSGVIAAQWSPDGKYIAFLTWGTPVITPDRRWRGVVVDPQGQNPLGIGLYRWPAGDIVTFFEVGQVDFDYSNLWWSPPPPLTLAWSPDGGQLVYGDGTGRVWILSADGRFQYELPVQRQPSSRGARWSADGQWLALPGANTLRIFAIPCSP